MWSRSLSSVMEPEPLDPLAVRFRRSTRIWQIVALAACIFALILTAIAVWLAVSWNNSTASQNPTQSPPPAPRSPYSRCPVLPSLLALPSPMPKRVTDALKTIDSQLRSMTNKAENKSAISMNVFYHDSIIFRGHYGSKIYKGKSAPDDNTVYRIGSVTKIFAVILLFKLYEDGRIASLDDPLVKYAPNFGINNPFTGTNITLRQIAGQMSGLPREAPCVYSCANTNTAEQLKILSKRNLVMEPWTQPSYSNLGYALLGRILTENILNSTFEEWTKREVLDPLGMKNTGFKITEKVKEDIAMPYYANGTIFPFIILGWADPAGGMYSTVDDLMKLAVTFTNPARKGGVKILRQETIRQMLLPEFLTRDGFYLWGSPYEMRYTQNFVARQKGGNIDSYNAIFSVIPELHLAVNILVNNQNAFPYGGLTCERTADLIHQSLIPALNKTLLQLQSKSTFPIDAKPFIGTYLATQIPAVTHKVFKYKITVKKQADKLVALPVNSPLKGFVATYIGDPFLFQAESIGAGILGPCFNTHLGIYGMVRFDPPDSKGLSGGFSAPCWKVTAKRIKDSSKVYIPQEAQPPPGTQLFPQFMDFTQI